MTSIVPPSRRGKQTAGPARWSQEDLATFRRRYTAEGPSPELCRTLMRSPQALKMKAYDLGLRHAHSRPVRPPSPPKQTRPPSLTLAQRAARAEPEDERDEARRSRCRQLARELGTEPRPVWWLRDKGWELSSIEQIMGDGKAWFAWEAGCVLVTERGLADLLSAARVPNMKGPRHHKHKE